LIQATFELQFRHSDSRSVDLFPFARNDRVENGAQVLRLLVLPNFPGPQ